MRPGRAGPELTGLASLRRGSGQPLSEAYDVALLDLDGVVYVGRTRFPGRPRRWPRRPAPGCGWPS